MKKHSLNTLVLAAAVLVGTTFGAAGDASAQERKFISIGTGGPTGVYFVVGNSVCRMVQKEAVEGRKKGRKHGIRCAAPSTGGSTYNIGQICQGELEFGVAQSDWQHHAVNGSSDKVTNCPGPARGVLRASGALSSHRRRRARTSRRSPTSRASG